MQSKSTEYAPFLSSMELKALSDESLPFDAVALYVRAFERYDVESCSLPIVVSQKTMTSLNGYFNRAGFKAMRRARCRTLIGHLERVGLIDKPEGETHLRFKREYNLLLSAGAHEFTMFESSILNNTKLSYEAICLYVRAIRPNLNADTFISAIDFHTVSLALTFVPLMGSSEPYINSSTILKSSLNELKEAGLITVGKEQNTYFIHCHVGRGFNSNWFKRLADVT